MVFINFEKTYDKGLRDVLWRCLETKGVLVIYIKAIKDIYDEVKTRVRTIDRKLQHFPIKMRLH